MTCNELADRLTESARHEVEPGRVLKAHMLSCAACRERWEAEGALTNEIKALRVAAWSQRSSVDARDALMQRFERQNRPRVSPRWYWSLGAVAAALIVALAVPGVHRPFLNRAAQSELADGVNRSGAETGDSSEIRADAPADPESEGFIAVPFVPPLATGEMLRVVHTELNPAALASLGVSVDPSWTMRLPADVLLGEDGMPRAVRVSDSFSGEGGF
jgi:hypothetical protein